MTTEAARMITARRFADVRPPVQEAPFLQTRVFGQPIMLIRQISHIGMIRENFIRPPYVFNTINTVTSRPAVMAAISISEIRTRFEDLRSRQPNDLRPIDEVMLVFQQELGQVLPVSLINNTNSLFAARLFLHVYRSTLDLLGEYVSGGFPTTNNITNILNTLKIFEEHAHATDILIRDYEASHPESLETDPTLPKII